MKSVVLAVRLPVASFSILVALVTASMQASDGPAAAESLARLKSGNARFVADPAEPMPIDAAQRAAAAHEHRAMAAILSCTDPRVPPEVIFRTGLGELVVVRTEGQVTDKAVLASIERATTVGHVPLLVVMGHESCDLVATASGDDHGHDDPDAGENVEYLTKRVQAAVSRAAALPADVRTRAAILENVEEQINELLQGSAVVRRLVDADELAVVGAYYELASGLVHFSEFVKVAPAIGESGRKH